MKANTTTLPEVQYPHGHATIPDLNAPSGRMRLGELGVVNDFTRGLFSGLWWSDNERSQGNQPADTPHRIVLLPGFGSSARAMFALRNLLKNQGFRVDDWGLGVNDGDVPRLLEAMTLKLKQSSDDGEQLILVGWSLGGYIAREAARECPAAVRKIITLGTPVIGGPRYTAAAGFYSRRGWDLDEIDHETLMRYETPLTLPVTALYSRRDGVVAWQACIDQWSPNITHIEVDCTHLGMAYEPSVLRLVEQECKNTSVSGLTGAALTG